MAINSVRPLAFSDPFIDATLVENARDFTVESGVTINLDDEPMQIGGSVPQRAHQGGEARSGHPGAQ
jgi:hypothetical protein